MRSPICTNHKFSYHDSPSPIHIGYGIDDNYARCCASSLLSIAKNNTNNFIFHILASNISEISIDKFHQLAKKHNLDIRIYKITEDMLPDLPTKLHLPLPTYYRFLLPMVVSEYNLEFLLYVDADMICTNALDYIFNIDWKDNEIIAAVPDVEWMNIKRNKILGLKNHQYFNAGMLVINLKRWKDFDVYNKVLNILLTNPELYSYLDQDALNVVLQGKIKYLETKYNCIEYAHKNIEDLAIIHFAAHPKPWSLPWELRDDLKPCYRNLYRYYEIQTPFAYLLPTNPKTPKEIRLYARLLLKHGHYIQFTKYYLKYILSKL